MKKDMNNKGLEIDRKIVKFMKEYFQNRSKIRQLKDEIKRLEKRNLEIQKKQKNLNHFVKVFEVDGHQIVYEKGVNIISIKTYIKGEFMHVDFSVFIENEIDEFFNAVDRDAAVRHLEEFKQALRERKEIV